MKVCISMDTIDGNLVLKIEIILLSASVNVDKDCFFHTLFMSWINETNQALRNNYQASRQEKSNK